MPMEGFAMGWTSGRVSRFDSRFGVDMPGEGVLPGRLGAARRVRGVGRSGGSSRDFGGRGGGEEET